MMAAKTTAPRVRLNVLANFVGKLWMMALALGLIPFYVRLLGKESYGLIGFMTTMQAVMAILDLGLSTTLNRELARLSALPDTAQTARNLVRTLEFVYWGVTLIVGVTMALLAPFLATHWFHAEHLSPQAVRYAVLASGATVAIQFPFALYQGGLLGLQRQVLLNGLNVGMTTLRSFGAVWVLLHVSATIQAFCAWQACAALVQTIMAALALWHSLPPGNAPARFHLDLLKGIQRFALGMSGIGILAATLVQMDTLTVSKLLSLKTLGYYMLATVVAQGLYTIIEAVYSGVFPRFSQLATQATETEQAQFYHRACQVMTVILLPVAVLLSLFAPEVLLVWTRDPDIAHRAHWLVTLLVIGTAANGLLSLPYAFLLAHGTTKVTLRQGIVAVLLYIPALLFTVPRYGAVGAACVCALMNLGRIFAFIQELHRLMLPDEKARWYLQDVGLPLIAALAVGLAARWLLPPMTGRMPLAASLVTIYFLIASAALLATPLSGALRRRGFRLGAPIKSNL